MRKLTACLFTIVIAVSIVESTQAAGPYGHFIVSKRVIDSIEKGKDAPTELREVLKDPECQKAFSGGAVAPDICAEESHYGNTADLADKMLADAHSHLATAIKAHDFPSIQRAREELAFSYGWLTHCAADLEVHPKVNSIVGDAFSYTRPGDQLDHGAIETQMDYYLYKNFKKSGEKYDVKIPYEFLGKAINRKPGDLRNGMRVLSLKAMGELAWKDEVKISDAELRKTWRDITLRCYSESMKFINNKKEFQNWDLDAGRISTENFKKLREMVMADGGGKLPKNWGSTYMQLYEKYKGKLSGGGSDSKHLQELANAIASYQKTVWEPKLYKSAKEVHGGNFIGFELRITKPWTYTPAKGGFVGSYEYWQGLKDTNPQWKCNGKFYDMVVSTGEAERQLKELNKGSGTALSKPPDAREEPSIALGNTFPESEFGYTIKYPSDWVYTKSSKYTVVFSGKEGTDAYYSTVSIQNIAPSQAGGLYKDVDSLLKAMEDQITTGAENAKIIDEKVFDCSAGGEKLTGKGFKTEYSRQGENFKQCLIVVQRADGKAFHVWSYTSPAPQYDTFLKVAQAMIDSWVIAK